MQRSGSQKVLLVLSIIDIIGAALMLLAGLAFMLGGAAIGATVNVNVAKRSAIVNTGDNVTLSAGKNLSSRSLGKDTSVLVTAAVGGSSSSAAVSGFFGRSYTLSSYTWIL